MTDDLVGQLPTCKGARVLSMLRRGQNTIKTTSLNTVRTNTSVWEQEVLEEDRGILAKMLIHL